MQDLVNTAIDNHQEEQEFRDGDTDSDEFDEFGDPNILVVGCGGAGNNTVNRLYNMGVGGGETIALNTDKQHLKMIEADTKILVGKSLTEGLGAGGDPSMGARATEMAQGTIKEALGDPDLVFVTAGMGGGTGTGASPVVAEIASDMGAIVVGMVSTPFDVERARRENAKDGLNKLREHSDSVIVLDNNRLLDYVPNLPIGKAFSVMDQIIAETVKGISETITQPSLINLDYADMANTMNNSGVAVMLLGETQDKNKVDEAVNDALSHPLLDVDYQSATGGLIHITGGPNLSLKEAQGISEKLTSSLGNDANVIWGARIRDDYQDKVRVMAIMTGVNSPQVLGENGAASMSSSGDGVSASIQEVGDTAASPPSAEDASADGGVHSQVSQHRTQVERHGASPQARRDGGEPADSVNDVSGGSASGSGAAGSDRVPVSDNLSGGKNKSLLSRLNSLLD